MLSQILTSTPIFIFNQMQRLSDVMSNVNLTLHRRLVPAGLVLLHLTIQGRSQYVMCQALMVCQVLIRTDPGPLFHPAH